MQRRQVNNTQRVSQHLTSLGDIEGHARRLGRLVCAVRVREYESTRTGALWYSQGEEEATAPTIRVAAFRPPTAAEMGLALGAPQLAKADAAPTQVKGAPGIARRSSLFSGQKIQPPSSPTHRCSSSSLRESILQCRAPPPHTPKCVPDTGRVNGPIRSFGKPVSDTAGRAMAAVVRGMKFIEGLKEDAVKAAGGITQMIWQSEHGQSGHQPVIAKFKAGYSDFKVTEIPMGMDGTGAAAPLPRLRGEKNFSIPAMPAFVQQALGMRTTSVNIFEPVDVEAQLTSAMSLSEVKGATGGVGDSGKLLSERGGRKRVYVQCVLHKRRLPHGVAVRLIADTLGIPKSRITWAGIKDYVADTVQYIRIEGTSPGQLLQVNRTFKAKRIRLEMSDFSYHEDPLTYGDLFGNSFSIVLRDLTSADADRVVKNAQRVSESGCLNHFGSQRFSFFEGANDATVALLKGNWLLFAFKFLNFTDNPNISMKELLQRPRKYPVMTQNTYRYAIVKRLKACKIEPTVLDDYPQIFGSTPGGAADRPIEAVSKTELGGKSRYSRVDLVHAALQGAFFDIDPPDRNMMAQTVSSYFWNIVLGARYHAFGNAVLEGDLVSLERFKDGVNRGETQGIRVEELAGSRYGVVTAANRDLFSLSDVVLPSFTFGNQRLPGNATAKLYEKVCSKYHLSWDLRCPALRQHLTPSFRPIIVKPTAMNCRVEAQQDDGGDGGLGTERLYNATIDFTLQRGSYATVVLAEILEVPHCLGLADAVMRPRPYAEWLRGTKDPRHVSTMASLYHDGDEVGGSAPEASEEDGLPQEVLPDTDEEATFPESAAQMASDAYRYSAVDVTTQIREWSSYHLVRNGMRRLQEDEEKRAQLFEPALAQGMNYGDVDRYISGHSVPISPNAHSRAVRKALRKRHRGSPNIAAAGATGSRFSGARVRRSAMKKSYIQRPTYGLLNVNTWNFK